VVTNCAVLPTANAGQHTTSNCKPLLFWFPCKWWYISVWIFYLSVGIVTKTSQLADYIMAPKDELLCRITCINNL